MPEYIRVKNERGDEYSVVKSAFNKDVHTEVKNAPAADVNGDPLPAVPATHKASPKAATSDKEK